MERTGLPVTNAFARSFGGLAMLLHAFVVLAPARLRRFLLLQLELLQARVVRAAGFFSLVRLALTLLASSPLRFRSGRAQRDPVRRLLPRRGCFLGCSGLPSKHLVVAVLEFAEFAEFTVIFVSHRH